MAALTADVQLPHQGTPTKLRVPATGADTYFKGALVFADATNGKAQVGSLAAGDYFLGICAQNITTTAADEMVQIFVDGVWGFPIASVAAADMGAFCVVDSSAITDNPADVESSKNISDAADDILLGDILSVYDSRAWVRLGAHYPKWVDGGTDDSAAYQSVAR